MQRLMGRVAQAGSRARRDPNARLLFSDTLTYVVGKAVPGVSGLLAVLALTRLLQADEYGRYALNLSVVMTAAAFSTGWLSQGALRYYGEAWWHSGAGRRAVRMALGLSVLAGVLCLVVVGTFSELGTWRSRAFSFTTTLALFVAASCYQLGLALHQARLDPKAVVRASVVQAITGIAVPVFLVLSFGRNHALVILGLAVSYAVPQWGMWRDRARDLEGLAQGAVPTGRHVRYCMMRLWNYGWPLAVWFTLTSALSLSDRYFVQRSWGFAAAGDYSALYDVMVRVFSLLVFPITQAAHPRIMRLWNEGQVPAARRVWLLAMAGAGVLSALATLVALPFHDVLAHVVLGARGAGRGPLVLPLLVAGMVWQMSLLAHKPLEVAARTPLMVVGAAAALATSVGGNYVLIPRIGPLGAALTQTASGLVYVLLTLALARAVRSSLLVRTNSPVQHVGKSLPFRQIGS